MANKRNRISRKIQKLRQEGYGREQAVAIALEMDREKKKRRRPNPKAR